MCIHLGLERLLSTRKMKEMRCVWYSLIWILMCSTNCERQRGLVSCMVDEIVRNIFYLVLLSREREIEHWKGMCDYSLPYVHEKHTYTLHRFFSFSYIRRSFSAGSCVLQSDWVSSSVLSCCKTFGTLWMSFAEKPFSCLISFAFERPCNKSPTNLSP